MRMGHTEVRAQARTMYESDEPWPLLTWLEEWRARTIDVDASSVVQVVHAYTKLVMENGPRAVDLGSIARRPYATGKVE